MGTVWEPVFAMLTGKKRRQRKSEQEDTATAKDWLGRITRAVKVKENWKAQFRIPLCYEYYEGRNRPAYYSEAEWFSKNMIYAVLKSSLPSLYSSDPYFYVKLKKTFSPDPKVIQDYELRGNIRQSMLNYLKGELGLKSKARMAILDAFFQFGVLKTTLSADLLENPKAGAAIVGNNGEELTGDDGELLKEPELLPANEAYETERVHPDDFVVDEDAGPLDESVSWCAQRVVRRLKEVQKDKRYTKSARESLKATQLTESEQDRLRRKQGAGLLSTTEAKPELVALWEVYDHEEEKWFVVAEGSEEYLLPPSELPKGMEKNPFSVLRFTLRDDSWLPIPPVSQWLDPQREVCETRSQLIRHRKKVSARKYLLYRQAFEDAEDAASRLEQAEDGTVLIADMNPGYAPIAPIQDAQLDQTYHIELGYLNRDFEDVATGANQRGSSQGVDSATEAGILEMRARAREGDERGLIADWIIDFARKLDALVQANITRDQAVRVTGPQGEFWAHVRQQDYEEIEGEYEYSIDVDTAIPQVPEVERAQWTAFLGLLANAPQMMTSKSLLKKMAELHHINDESMVEELYSIGQKIMGGQMAQPGTQGSLPGVPSPGTDAAAAVGGTAAGMNNIRGGMQ